MTAPENLVKPGFVTLVVEPIINNYNLSWVLFNGWSSLDVLFTDTLNAIQIPWSAVKLVAQSFFGIVPRSLTSPIDQIVLSVIFGVPENFRIEKILFNVTDFQMAFNTILG